MNYESEPTLKYAWIYIAIDIRHLDICKIGLTIQKNPLTRIKRLSTANPYFELFNSYDMTYFNISKRELYNLEKYFHKKLGTNIYNLNGNKTEWLRITPFEAEIEIDDYINNTFKEYDDQTDIISNIKIENRPDPLPYVLITNNEYHDNKEYIDYLMQYHNYPTNIETNKL